MSNKRIQVSDDDGATWYTLPGNQGEMTNEANQVDDTIFGQTYQSNFPSLAQFMTSANGLFKGVAGYSALLKKSGTPTSMTGEATSLVTTDVYQITDPVKRVISFEDAFTVLDGVTNVTAQVEFIDYLAGIIYFLTAYTVVGAITVTGKYMPMATMAKARSFTLTQQAGETDTTVYEVAQANNGHRTFDPSLRTANLEVGHIFAASNGWLTALEARDLLYVTIDLEVGNAGKTVARGFYRAVSRRGAGNQGEVETETVQLALSVPDGELVLHPFNWYFASSPLNQAIQIVLQSWLDQSTIKLRYLPTGAIGATPEDGQEGDVIVTECSLANQIDGMNEYTFNFRGTGEPEPV